ncbi:hypothetical protein PC9H_009219 [Pleurotus ostreatus]|uniref:N-acetyltransferase domain-containing protein n=1 Tax=Pleurotus ostreatus TaxID=5322 RepID=A0A8H6ZQY3_PLEOS|nr:uncharacterized protein PC9H_009219 [Pleurotus ostreatus]KAF7423921.1 hypothetical protein PC9H_009219 [Pleurotus ostreatus]
MSASLPKFTQPTDEPYDINFAYPLNLDILQTPKIKLVPFIPSVHAVPFYAAATKTPETMHFIPFHFTKLDDFLVNVVGPFQASPDYPLLTIIDKLKLEQGAEEKDCIAGVIGYLGLSTMRRSLELGPVIVLPEYQRTHVSTHAIEAAMRYILEVPAQGGLGWRRMQTERMGMKVEAAAMQWSFCLQEEKQGIVVPAERGGGKGRHSTLLAVCWDDWEHGVRDHVAKLIAR